MSDFQKQYWNQRAARYARIYGSAKSGLERLFDRLFRKAFAGRLEQTFCYLGKLEGVKLFDAGCGPGVYLRRALDTGALEVTGLDISPQMLEQSASNLRAYERGRWSLINYDFELYEPMKRYSAVLALGLLEYLYSPMQGLKKLSELTGDTLICTFSRSWSVLGLSRRILLKLKGIRAESFSKNRIKEMADRANLIVTQIKKIGATWWVAFRGNGR